MELQYAQGERAAGGGEASNIVTETGAGASKSQRKKFRQINGETGEQRELKESHQGTEYKDLPRMC
jgi:hypothetical protein